MYGKIVHRRFVVVLLMCVASCGIAAQRVAITGIPGQFKTDPIPSPGRCPLDQCSVGVGDLR